MRLIDADALLEALKDNDINDWFSKDFLFETITNAPTVQREEQDKHMGVVTQHYGFVSDNKDTDRLNWLQLHFDSALTRENIDIAMISAAPTDKE